MLKLSRVFVIIFISLVVDLLAFTVILPLLPSLLDHYAENDKGELFAWMENRVTYFQSIVGAPGELNKVVFGGLIGSLFSFLQYMSSPVIGALSDVYGRKIILLLTMGGMACSYLLWWMSLNYFSLFVISRVVGGISKGNIGLCQAIVTDVSTEENRGKGMALIGVAFSVGFIVGPSLGAAFAAWGRHQGQSESFATPAIFAFTLVFIDLIFLMLCFKETLPMENRARSVVGSFSEAYKFISPTSLFTFRPVENIAPKEKSSMKRLGVVYFLFLFLYSGLEYSLTFLTHNRFHYTSSQQGKLYLFSGLIMSAVQGGYVRRISPGTEIKTALTGLFLVIPAFITIGVAPNTTVLYCGLALYAFASATVVPCLTTGVSKYGAMHQKGTILGIFRSLGALARALGPFLASLVYWSLGPSLCYALGGLFLLVPWFLLRNVHRQQVIGKSQSDKTQ